MPEEIPCMSYFSNLRNVFSFLLTVCCTVTVRKKFHRERHRHKSYKSVLWASPHKLMSLWISPDQYLFKQTYCELQAQEAKAIVKGILEAKATN